MQRVTIPAFIRKFLFSGGYFAGRNMACFFVASKGKQLTGYNTGIVQFLRLIGDKVFERVQYTRNCCFCTELVSNYV